MIARLRSAWRILVHGRDPRFSRACVVVGGRRIIDLTPTEAEMLQALSTGHDSGLCVVRVADDAQLVLTVLR